MLFGIESFTALHVLISLAGIAAGFVVAGGLLANARLEKATAIFFVTTIATNVTGLLFPFSQLLPSHILAIVSLVLLAVAGYAYYARRLQGLWRIAYIVTAIGALYINFLVLLVQTFIKNPALAAIAPTQTEAPFVAAQLTALLLFIWIGIRAVQTFRP